MVTWQDRNSDHLSINLALSDEVSEIMKKRHLQQEEIQFAIYYGELENNKMYDPADPGRFLIKCTVGEGLYHAEYIVSEESGKKIYNLLTAYACRTRIKE